MDTIKSVGAAAAALALFATPAFAAAPDGEPSYVAVKLAQVSPATPGQAQTALAVLENAALEACGASSFSVPPHRQAVRGSACWRTSMDDVVARLGNPLLTAAYQRHLPTVEVASAAGGASGGSR